MLYTDRQDDTDRQEESGGREGKERRGAEREGKGERQRLGARKFSMSSAANQIIRVTSSESDSDDVFVRVICIILKIV